MLLISILQGLPTSLRGKVKVFSMAYMVLYDWASHSLPELPSHCSLPAHSAPAILASPSCFWNMPGLLLLPDLLPPSGKLSPRVHMAYSVTCPVLCSDATFPLRLFPAVHMKIAPPALPIICIFSTSLTRM